ncbi:MAG: DUF1659 domain-containing protein [Neobacillus sp.]|jgi:hypothetical protein
MAEAILATTKLRLVFQVGMDDDGKAIYKFKTFSNVKRESTTDQLFQAAEALYNLSSDTLSRVERMDTSDLLG